MFTFKKNVKTMNNNLKSQAEFLKIKNKMVKNGSFNILFSLSK